MSESRYIIGKVYDAEFSVESTADYQTLIGFLAMKGAEYIEENPGVDPRLVWITYTADNWIDKL